MKLEFSTWTHHLNQLIYSYFYFCQETGIKVKVIQNTSIKHNCAILYLDDTTLFFDYSDDTKFMDSPEKSDYYFKRSLLAENHINNVFPLNFNVPLAYKSPSLLLNLKRDILFDKASRKEIIRALDIFSFFKNSSHSVLDVRKYPETIKDFNGNVIFHTRLWNPDNHSDPEEKERRRKQNEFRINACRLIKKTYKNSSVGLTADVLSTQLAPDLLLDSKYSNKKNYFETLKNYNICIADDGLKDTPGWKIGEYLLFGKAVITTPLNVVIEKFDEHINYEKLSTRNSYLELPDKIDFLIKEKKYLEMGENNLIWSENYLHPKNYIKRIMSVLENKS